MKNVVIYGASYPDTLEIIRKNKKIKVIGFIDDIKYGTDDYFMGEKILGDIHQIKKYVKTNYFFINNVFNPPKNRKKVQLILNKCNAKTLNVIHPNLDIANVDIGENIWIHDGVKIGANAKIGNNVVIRFNSIINHDNIIEDDVFISPGVILAGHVKIKKNTLIGTGAIILPHITIGENVIVGAGSVVNKDIPNNCTYVGNPARELKRKI